MMDSKNLKSRGVTKLMYGITLVFIASGILLILAILAMFLLNRPENNYTPGTDFAASSSLIVLNVFLLLFLLQGIVFIFWIYRLHLDFKRLFQNYPISPGYSLVCILIPFYNLWGIWHIYSTFSEHLYNEDEKIQKISSPLMIWVFIMYASGVASFIAAQLGVKSPEEQFPLYIIAYFAALVLFAFSFLKTVVIIRNVLELKIKILSETPPDEKG